MPNEDEVLKAIGEILARGENPTYEAVQRIVGGSKRDLAPIMKEWRDLKMEKTEKKVRPLAEKYESLDFIEKREFQLETDLMDATPTELKRRQDVDKNKGRK